MAHSHDQAYVVRVDQVSMHETSTFWEDLVFMREHHIAPIIVAPDRQCARGLVQRINRSSNTAVCVSGADGATLPTAGESLRSVQTRLLKTLMDAGFLPVVEPVGFAPLGQDVVIEADQVAAFVAAATEAKRVIFFTGTGGVIDPVTCAPIAELTPAEALSLADDERIDSDVRHIIRAAALGVRHGVQAASIIDGRVAHASIIELLTKQRVGTEVRGSIYLGGKARIAG